MQTARRISRTRVRIYMEYFSTDKRNNAGVLVCGLRLGLSVY